MALPHKDDKARCESLLPTSCPEKAQRRTEPGPKRTMSSRRLAVALFLCFLVTYGFAAAISPRYRLTCNYHHHGQVSEAVADEHQGEAPQGSLSTLLNSVSPDALHRMLHTYFPDRYQHGVYETDRQAVEAVHANNPALASSIVQIAKRQGTNSTSPTQTSTSTTTPASSPTTAHTTTTTETSTSTSVSPTTTTPSSTSTTTHGPDTTSSTTQTTPTTSAKKSSSLVTATFTSTAPNGQATVVTATSYVEANPSPTGTTGAAGSIQTGNSAPGNPAALPAWAGIILGGLLLI